MDQSQLFPYETGTGNWYLLLHSTQNTEHWRYGSIAFIPATEIHIFLTSIRYFFVFWIQLGYTIFVVFGELPECEADNLFIALRRGEDGKYVEEIEETAGYKLGSELDEEESLHRGIQLSLAKTPAEAIRAQREAFLNRFGSTSSCAATVSSNSSAHSSPTCSSSAGTSKGTIGSPSTLSK